MAVEIKVPSAGESIAEVYVGEWKKSGGDVVEKGEVLVELETDKATLELPAPVSGRLVELRAAEGDRVEVGAVIAVIDESAAGSTQGADAGGEAPAAGEERGTAAPQAHESPAARAPQATPSARRLLAEYGLRPEEVAPTAPGEARVRREDVLAHVRSGVEPEEVELERGVRVAPMTPIRMRIAERLVSAQQSAALLTTFNEVDMSEVIALRSEFQEAFQAKHGVKLGFMSFFVKAASVALREIPQLNAQIVEDDRGRWHVRYHDYCDIGIAVGGGKGLVVPVLRNAERMSFAEIEAAIRDFAERAKTNKIGLEELEGGTFTISNGGVYGSLLSTPIVNPPQSGILGLHAIQERPVAKNGQVVIAKMMYIALTYDHRIVDGREAVTFLRRIKECVERPERMWLDV